MSAVDYEMAGVNIAAGNEAVRRIKHLAEKTFSPQVLTPIGGFGALYDLKAVINQYEHPVLVQSIDGVGTKTAVAQMMGKFDTLGIDVVSATANDIVVLGATPLTLLDYIATERLKPDIVEQIIRGMAGACLENGIALIGGETAEMPGTYRSGEHDLVGVVTGVVEKNRVISGQDIRPGDVVMGFCSSGLHTNGYSLARKLFFEVANWSVDHWLDELQTTVGEALLEPHINYTRPIQQLLANKVHIKGMAHITGGGFIENIPRILPKGCAVEIQSGSWPILPVFEILCQLGQLTQRVQYQTFNMGIGLVLIVSEDQVQAIERACQDFNAIRAYTIGHVLPSDTKEVRII